MQEVLQVLQKPPNRQSLGGIFKRIPVIFKVQALGLTLAALVVLVVNVMAGTHGLQRIAFAIPSADRPQITWSDERDAFAAQLVRAFGVRSGTATEFSAWILEAARRQQLAPELLASLVLTESSFRKHVRSNFGAIGPTQVRQKFWQSFCGADITDPEENVYCGAQILSHYQDACGGAEVCALQSYNVGPYNVNQEGFIQAGARYVNKIDRHRAMFNSAL